MATVAKPGLLRSVRMPASCRHLPDLLLDARTAAEAPARGESCLVGARPGVAQVHLLELVMETQLALELALEAAAPQERAKSVTECVDDRHDPSARQPRSSTRAIAPDTWS
jgi:hypothetical protein